jgi:hypothetical protein
MPYNGYSEEYLDRLDNGSIPADNKSYNKRKSELHSLTRLIRKAEWIRQGPNVLFIDPGFENEFHRRKQQAQQSKTIVTVDWENSSGGRENERKMRRP